MKEKTGFTIQEAGFEDIPILVRHHRLMFEEIWTLKGLDYDISKLEEMDNAYAKKLQKQLTNNTSKAWFIEDISKIIASGAVSIISMVPVPDDPSDRVAYLHSIYTERGYRNRGFARRIAETAIHYCKSQGIRRMILNASDAGRPVYEKTGFRAADNVMRLWIK
ncbi:GNAT family N-acetyltransferase [Desulfobacterales bacterium HSG2]|nr:GNAT family N-acetyltransferase [Desulfobacterales bacterium HSG2]